MNLALRTALEKCRRHVIAAALFSALVNLLYIAPTLYMLQVYDRVVQTQGLQTLIFLTIALVFALATLSLLDRVRSRLLVRAGVQLDTSLAPLILNATLGRPDFPQARQALRDFDGLRATLTGPGVLALLDAPWTPIYIVACFLVHPLIGALAILGCTILPLLALANQRGTRSRLNRAHAVAGATYANQDALLDSADAIRALGMREALVARQLRQRVAMVAFQTEANFVSGSYLTGTKFTRLVLQSLALGLGALLAVNNQISGGAIFASSFLMARALAPIEQLINGWKPVGQARLSLSSLSKLLDTSPAEAVPTRLPAPTGALSVENIVVFNDTRDGTILNGVSFKVNPGEGLAIVGPSGAGKSTLIRALAGALLPDRGVVRFDEADARDWDTERLARHIGYLPQDSALFGGSISENIARFSVELDSDRSAIDAEVVAAAVRVGADSLIRRLPNGYDHQLKLGGRGVSAGQAQRIALARAVYGAPKLLILDEPNAHLDVEGDAALAAAIVSLKAEGCTVLIVSHKLSIMPVIDKMLVLRDGRVHLFGTRDEVLPKIAPSNLRRVASPAVAGA